MLRHPAPAEIDHVSGVRPDGGNWKATLLLIHGIDGHGLRTWHDRTGGLPWYSRMSSEIEGLSVFSAFLEYRKFRFRRSRAERLIEEYSFDLVDSLARRGLFDRPLYVVAHSLGGILAKRMKADALEHPRARYFEQRRNMLKGVFFLGVPHHGSPFARRFSMRIASFLGLATVTSGDLRPGSRMVKDIQRRYCGALQRYPYCKIVSFHETLPICQSARWFQGGRMLAWVFRRLGPVVPRQYSEIKVDKEMNVEVELSHLNITKLNRTEATCIFDNIMSTIKADLQKVPQWPSSRI